MLQWPWPIVSDTGDLSCWLWSSSFFCWELRNLLTYKIIRDFYITDIFSEETERKKSYSAVLYKKKHIFNNLLADCPIRPRLKVTEGQTAISLTAKASVTQSWKSHTLSPSKNKFSVSGALPDSSLWADVSITRLRLLSAFPPVNWRNRRDYWGREEEM